MYALECNDGSIYCGITTDIERRLYEHNNTTKGAKYTKTRRPVKLLKTWKYDNRSEASKEEYKFKKLKRFDKLKLIYV